MLPILGLPEHLDDTGGVVFGPATLQGDGSDGSSEGIELVMWLVMRGAFAPKVREVYRASQVPTPNTHNGLLILENV